MTASCDRLGAKVNEFNGNLHSEPQGELQGRDVAVLPYYLLVGGAVVGVLATVAITVAAVAFAKLSLVAVIATCSLLCIASIFGAVSLHRINRIIGDLFNTVDNLKESLKDQKIADAKLDGKLDNLMIQAYEAINSENS